MLKKLKTKTEELLKLQDDLTAKAFGEGRAMSEGEQSKYDEASATIDANLAQIKAAKERNAARAELATVGAETAPEVGTKAADITGIIDDIAKSTSAVAVEVKDGLSAVEQVGMFAWCAAMQKLNKKADPYEHLDNAGYKKIGDTGRAHRAQLVQEKALVSIAGAGANTVFTPLSSEFIEFLRNASAFLRAGPVRIDLPNGSLNMTGGAVGTSGTYGAEGASSPYTEMTTRQISLNSKQLKAHTAVNNYLVETSPLAVAQIMGDDLANGLTLGIDAAGLRGTGIGDNPAGLLSLINAANQVAAAAGVNPTLVVVTSVLRDMLTKIRASNVPERRRVWTMNSRVFGFLQFMRDGNGNLAWPGMSKENPTLLNYPVIMSEQVPGNLGVGTNESEIYLTDFGHVLMGVSRDLRLKVSDEATYRDAGGNLRSAFDTDEMVIRGIASHDFAMRHDLAGSITTAVQWGG